MGEHQNGISPDGKTCLNCGENLFKVVPGVTTQEEIINFAKDADGWQENPEALEGWMPSGIFCKNGCVAIHADYPAPWKPDKNDTSVPTFEPDTYEVQPQKPNLLGDLFWNGLIVVGFVGLVVGAVQLVGPDISWGKVLANLLVLVFGTLILSILGSMIESIRSRQEVGYDPPFMAMFLSFIVGGVLTLFFGWTSTWVILGLYGVLVLASSLVSQE